MKNIVQEYWGGEQKIKLNFGKSPFPTYTFFEKTLFVDTHLIREDLKQIEKSHGGSLNHWVGVLMNITV